MRYNLVLYDKEGELKLPTIKVKSRNVGNIGIGQKIEYSVFVEGKNFELGTIENKNYEIFDIKRAIKEGNRKNKGIEERLMVFAKEL
jgi:hypothetical protein